MSFPHLNFLQKYAEEDTHYNSDHEIDKLDLSSPVEFSNLTEFSDSQIKHLHNRGLKVSALPVSITSRLFSAKSKVELPNLVASNEFNDNNSMLGKTVSPEHILLAKHGALTSDSLKKLIVGANNNRWSHDHRGLRSAMTAESLYHPNLEKDDAKEIVDTAEKNNNPYISQMKRQYERRYKVKGVL